MPIEESLVPKLEDVEQIDLVDLEQIDLVELGAPDKGTPGVRRMGGTRGLQSIEESLVPKLEDLE
jgi:hypothetical protein